MAKWLKIKNTYFNLCQIQQIWIQDYKVMIDGMPVAELKSKEQAEQYIKDFIAEHYIQTGKVE